MTVKHNKDTEEYFFEEGCFITELWNESYDNGISIAQARLPAGERTLPHLLNDTTERYLILSGEGMVYVGNLKAVAVTQNDVVLIQPGEKQYIENTGNTDLVFLAICTPRFRSDNYVQMDT